MIRTRYHLRRHTGETATMDGESAIDDEIVCFRNAAQKFMARTGERVWFGEGEKGYEVIRVEALEGQSTS